MVFVPVLGVLYERNVYRGRAGIATWYGELDRNVPINAVRAMASQLSVASLEIIAGAGHLGWLIDEERVLRTLLDRADQAA